MDSSGNPVVSYRDRTNKNLKVLHCGDPNCTRGNSITAPDTGGTNGDVGTFTALALDSQGNPVVAYRDEANGDIKVLHCGNPNCTRGNSVVRIATPNNEGIDISMALDAASNPVITYYEILNADLRLRHCSNANCTDQTSGTFRALDVAGFAGRVSSLALDGGGRPVVSFQDGSQDLRVVRCNDANCNTFDSATPDPGTAFVGNTSLALDANGFPIIAYQNAVKGDLKLLHCGNADCTSGNQTTSPDTAGTTGLYTSLALDGNSIPVISYQDFDNRDLKVLRLRISNDGQFPVAGSGSWIPYQETLDNWDLGTPDSGSPAMVFVEFRDAAGNISETVVDSIIYCQPDWNGSGQIDISDAQAFASRWRARMGSPDYSPVYDIDGDGDIDTADLMIVARHFGEACG